MLHDIHTEQITRKTAKKARRIALPVHIWRTAAVAASVAILTSTITYSILTPSIKKTESQYNIIRRQVDNIKESQNQLTKSQTQLEKDLKKIHTPTAPVKYTGTGFALNNDGYFVTAYHVTSGADSIYIQDRNGEYFKATVDAFDENTDLVILKVLKKNFHFSKGEVPYVFAASKSGLGEHIYTLGYPKDQVVYSEGYISGREGYDGNDNQYSLVLPAGHGQSGSPVIDENGNILGIVTAISGEAEANTYAVSSKALIDLVHKKLPDNLVRLPKANKLGHMSREAQIKKMEAYTFSVKVYKK
jgi:S1-C subfamily serine protease